MQLIERDNLLFELKIDTLDDLWVLSEFVNPEDLVFSTTLRKVKIGNENSTKQIQKIIFIELLVKKTNFENNILRLSGEIQNETEFTAKGQSHTLNFNVNDKIKIQKKFLLKYEEKILERSLNSKNSLNFLVLMDRDELIVSEFSEYSYRVLFEKRGLGSKKYHLNEINENEEKFKLLEEFIKKNYSNIIFVGPGIWKENLKKYISDKIGLKILTFSYPDLNSSQISKVIHSITKEGILENSQINREDEILSKLLENISKGEKFVYSYNETIKFLQEGRVETLMISSKFLEKKKEDGSYQNLNEELKTFEQLNGNLIIINSKNPSGRVLDGLSGIAGILRY